MKKMTFPQRRLFLICFFAVIFVVGILSVKDYGISYDEVIERTSSLVTYKYLVPNSRYILTESVNFPALVELESYVDRYYGVALQQIPVIVEHIFGFELSSHNVYLMRHLYTFAIFFVSLIYFFLLLKECGVKEFYCVLGVTMLFLSPRIFADACYNIKDLPFMSVTIITLYYSIRFIKYSKIIDAVLLSFFAALCANIRVVGAIFFVICGILYLCFSKKRFWKRLASIAMSGGLCLGFYVFMMPALWSDPVGGIIELLNTFSSFSRWGGANYYLGTWYPEGTEPWHYMFVWIFATTPVVYGIYSLAGIVACAKDLVAKKTDGFVCRILFGSCILVPFVYLLIGHPVVYNGWRHFFFIYPMLLFFAVDFLNRVDLSDLQSKKRIQNLLFLCLWLSFAMTIAWGIKNHPYEYVYFNPLIRNYAVDNLEKDYWAVSEYDQMKEILSTDPADNIKVGVTSGSGNGLLYLNEQEQKRIEIVPVAQADYVIKTYAETPERENFASQYLFGNVNDIVVDDMVLSSLYRRNYDVASESMIYLRLNGENLEGACYLAEPVWRIVKDAGVVYLESIDLHEIVKTPLAKMVISEALYKASTGVYVQVDDIVHEHAKSTFVYCEGEYVLELSQDLAAATKIRIGIDLTMMDDMMQYVVKLVTTEMPEEITTDTYIDSLDANYNEDEIYLLMDGDIKTRWTSGVAQSEGMYIMCRLSSAQNLCGVSLKLGDSPWDYPVNLRLFVSSDGESWSEVEAVTEDNETFWFDAMACQYIRFELGKAEEELNSNWSIYELELFTKME